MKNNELIHKAKLIRLLILDLDGVLTDGSLYLTNELVEFKAFHVHDGMGLKLLMLSGVEVAVITTSRQALIESRMKQLGIQHVYMGQTNKTKAYDNILETLSLTHSQVAYVGDDLPDLPVMCQVGLSVAVADANSHIVEKAFWQTTKCGGRGAVREVCDLIMEAKNTLKIAFDRYQALETSQ